MRPFLPPRSAPWLPALLLALVALLLAAEGALARVVFHIDLGRGPRGLPVGHLYLDPKSEGLIPDFADPRWLRVSSQSRKLEQVHGPDRVIRQLVAPEMFVDIVRLGKHAYEIRVYRPEARERWRAGVYLVAAGAVPVRTMRVENPGASYRDFSRITITSTSGGTPAVYEYIWEPAESLMTMITEGGRGYSLKKSERRGSDLVVTRMEKDADGRVLKSSQETVRWFPWGPEKIESVADPGGAALATRHAYGTETTAAGRVKEETRLDPDGSWVRVSRNEQGREVKTVRPWLDAGPDAPEQEARVTLRDYTPVDPRDRADRRFALEPRTVVEQIAGIVVEKTYYAHYLEGSQEDEVRITERCVDPAARYGDPGNERTVEVFSGGRRVELRLPDGRVERLRHEFGTFLADAVPARSRFVPGAGSDVRETVVQGTAGRPDGVPYRSVRETNVRDSLGRELLKETCVVTGQGCERIRWEIRSYDTGGHLTRVVRSDNTVEEQVWDGNRRIAETDARGVTTRFRYDAPGRLTQVERPGPQGQITTTYTYDALDRRAAETESAGDLSRSTSRSYDSAERPAARVDSGGRATTSAYSADGLATTETAPDGSVTVTTRHRDGQLRSVTGSGVVARHYEYGVNPDGTRWTRVRTGAPDSPSWELTVSDPLGRTVRTERPGPEGVEVMRSSYDSAGRLVRSETSGVAPTLHVYDELGERVRSGLDLDGDGALVPGGSDRVEEQESRYVFEEGARWRHDERRVHADDEPLVRVSRTQLTGFDSPETTAAAVTIEADGNRTRERVTLERESATETRTVTYPGSSLPEVEVSVAGRLESRTGQTGVKTTYRYDALGRRTGSDTTGPGRAFTAETLGPDGSVVAREDNLHGRTTFAYDPATGRLASRTDALGAVERRAYDERGNLVAAWGDAVEPVRYEYDLRGRLARILTYRDGPREDSEAWPFGPDEGDAVTLRYDEATGLLLAVVDALGGEVAYRYGTGGRVATRTWAREEGGSPLVTTYRYDSGTGDLAGISYSDGTPPLRFTYDRAGRLRTVTDAVGRRTFTYDALGRVLCEEVTGLFDRTICRTYGAGGVPRKASGLSAGEDYRISLAYDRMGRVAAVSWKAAGAAGTATSGYHPDSDLLAELDYGDGLRSLFHYNERRLPSRLVHSLGDRVAAEHRAEYDALGRLVGAGERGAALRSPVHSRRRYDSRSRLVEFERYAGEEMGDFSRPLPSQRREFAYDLSGNRVSGMQDLALEYESNGAGRYVRIAAAGGGVTTLGYDPDGNLAAIRRPDGGGRYTYDAENRLAGVAPLTPRTGDRKLTYVYDFLGRRAAKDVLVFTDGTWRPVPGERRRFVHDGTRLIQELDGEGRVLKAYVWVPSDPPPAFPGGSGTPLAFVQDSSAAYYLPDLSGHAGQLVKAGTGDVMAHYEHDPFGGRFVTAGPWALDNPFRSGVGYEDDDTGLIWVGHGWLNLVLGMSLGRASTHLPMVPLP